MLWNFCCTDLLNKEGPQTECQSWPRLNVLEVLLKIGGPDVGCRVVPSTPAQLPESVNVTSECSATTITTLTGRGASNAFLGSIIVTVENEGNAAIQTPYTVSLRSDSYLGVSQVQGLTSPTFGGKGLVTGTASNVWDLLWPQSTNSISLGFVVLASNDTLTPAQVGGILSLPPPSFPYVTVVSLYAFLFMQ